VYDAFLGDDLGPRTLYHGHSYGGNALAAAVARRHLGLLAERDVLANVRARGEELGALLGARLAPRPAVREVRRAGLMTGIELAPPRSGLRWGRRVTRAMVDAGVLVRPLGDVVVLMPPLDVTSAELARIVDALDDAVARVAAEDGA
jgi:adenosylmethionine-8-amino-7-oxononanoate aminotransferase